MIDERFEKLGTKDKEEFKRVLNKLLRVNYINRDIYSMREKEMRINFEYRFLDRNFLLYEEYLALGGWSLNKDDRFGVIYISSDYEFNRARINKFTTLILLTLRLIYDEERENLTLKKEVSLTVHDLVQKMLVLGIVDKRPAFDKLHKSLQSLQGFNLIERMNGIWKEADTRFLIYPSILFVISNAKLNELADLSKDMGDGKQEIMDIYEGEDEDEAI